MFLKKIKSSKGRTFLQIVNGYRDEDGKVKHEVVESIGFLDELEDKYDDPILFFTEKAKTMTLEEKDKSTIVFDLKKELKPGESSLKNVGYLTLKPILDKLELNRVFNVLNVKHDIKYNLNEIFEFLVYSQLTNPLSKFSSYLKKEQFFENYKFSEDQMYRALSYFGNSFEAIKDYLYETLKEKFKLDTTTTFYDGTNFYFEIDREDDFRKKGPSKEDRKSPIVSFGLLLDKNNIPIDINVYPGNESESPHFRETIKNMKEKKKITGKTIYVADKGLNNGNNIYNALIRGDGYIYSQTVKGAKEETKKLIESPLGFIDITNAYGEVVYSIKGYEDIEEINYTDDAGNKKKAKIKQLKVITWSKQFADKAAYERAKLIQKAKKLIKDSSLYQKDKLGAASKYLKKVTYDSKGNVIKEQSELVLNKDFIENEARMDGYYLIVTSETKMNPKSVFDAYQNLYHIEETFRVAKLFLKVRPVYLQKEERIKAHVLVAYVSLILLRIMETKVLKNKFSFYEIINGIRNYQCALIKPNRYFFFSYNNYVLELANKSKANAKLETMDLLQIRSLFKNY